MTEPVPDMTHVRQTTRRFGFGLIFNFIFERPVGIGAWVGMVMGALNSLIFSLPIVASIIYGSLVGIGVCVVGCPAMRTIIKQHRDRINQRNITIKMRSRAVSVFTNLE